MEPVPSRVRRPGGTGFSGRVGASIEDRRRALRRFSESRSACAPTEARPPHARRACATPRSPASRRSAGSCPRAWLSSFTRRPCAACAIDQVRRVQPLATAQQLADPPPGAVHAAALASTSSLNIAVNLTPLGLLDQLGVRHPPPPRRPPANVGGSMLHLSERTWRMPVPEPEKPVQPAAPEESRTDKSAAPPAITWKVMLARGRQPKARVTHFYWYWVRNHPRKAISLAVRRAVFERDLHRCLCCGATEDLVIDHIYFQLQTAVPRGSTTSRRSAGRATVSKAIDTSTSDPLLWRRVGNAGSN